MNVILSGPLFSAAGRQQIAKHYEQQVYDLIAQKASDHLAALQCPVHHETPEAVIIAEPDGTHGLRVKGCCDQIITQAEAILSNIDLSEL